MIVDWESSENHLLLNPRLDPKVEKHFRHAMADAPSRTAHIWFATSGSTGKVKFVALSKEACLTSARAVNRHLESDASDRWALSLPTFHVGGLGILARAHQSGAAVVRLNRWDPSTFSDLCRDQHVTLASLVPTQLFDLVHQHISSPKNLRAVIVGGGELSVDLYMRGRDLGWNLLPSYGMTECASQIATASLHSLESKELPRMHLLPHLAARSNSEGCLEFCGDALFTTYLLEDNGIFHFCDPKVRGWFSSDDCGKIEGDALIFLGRRDEIVKVSGENVDIGHLERRLREMAMTLSLDNDLALVPVADGRLGCTLHLVVSMPCDHSMQHLVELFNAEVLPFERLRKVHHLQMIPRTPLGKIARAELLLAIGVKE